MSAHTPGPWAAFVDRQSKTVAVNIGAEPNGRRPCIVDWVGFDSCGLPLNQRIANARLIAAAPDLLEALKAMLSLARRDAPQLAGKTMGYAEAAIAKATGEQT